MSGDRGGAGQQGGAKRIEGDWSEADEKASASWGHRPDEPPAAPSHPGKAPMERMKEGYGTGKDGADPQRPDEGEAPSGPVG